METYALVCTSPIGPILLQGSEQGIQSLRFPENRPAFPTQHSALPDCLLQAAEQLAEYFCHKRSHFELPLDLQGTPFQQLVWKALCTIAPGQTISYGQLAKQLGAPGAARAVGMANALNPCLILLPCHRVVGNKGALTGYAGGLLRKQWLLQHEQQVQQLSLF